MISPESFTNIFLDRGIDTFIGVPDSLLKNLNSFLLNSRGISNQVAVNEGSAVGLAIGHFLSTGSPAAVYLQNSGFGNLINPLLSLADPEVYSIPMVIIIGWRGRPGMADEPQHIKQGRVLLSMLDAMEYKYEILTSSTGNYLEVVDDCISVASLENKPVFLIVEQGAFSDFESEANVNHPRAELEREESLEIFLRCLSHPSAVFSTTGMLSRELFEMRKKYSQLHGFDFLTIGGMGHTSSIALGFAKIQENIDTWCLDGDGSLLMHAGVLATIAKNRPTNFKHLVFNNLVHDSVGGQPTDIDVVDIPNLAKSMGYVWAKTVASKNELIEALDFMQKKSGPILLEVIVKSGARKDLSRPDLTPREQLENFILRLEY